MAVVWRWTTLQDWLLPQRVAEFMTRFFSPGGRALAAVAGIGLVGVLMVTPGLSLSVPLIATLHYYMGGRHHPISRPAN